MLNLQTKLVLENGLTHLRPMYKNWEPNKVQNMKYPCWIFLLRVYIWFKGDSWKQVHTIFLKEGRMYKGVKLILCQEYVTLAFHKTYR